MDSHMKTTIEDLPPSGKHHPVGLLREHRCTRASSWMPRCLAAFQITISAPAAWPARLSSYSRESGWRLPGGLGSGGAMLLSSFRCRSMTIPPDNPERKPMQMARHGAAFPPAVSSADRRGRHRADRQGGLRSPGFTPRAQRGRPRKDSPNPVRSPGPLEPHHDGFQGAES
jgi:hypothetical protein